MRTRQTADIILQELAQFPELENVMDERENDLLAEQRFGLFDSFEDHELEAAFPEAFAYYRKSDKYWHPPPQGEARYDVVCRLHAFFGTLIRDFDRATDPIENVIIALHGVTMRAFVKGFLHLPYEWLEDTVANPNPGNGYVRHIAGKRSQFVDRGIVFMPPEAIRTK